MEFIKSNYLIKETKKHCDSDPTVELAKVPCLDINTVDPAWATRSSEFDILMLATGGWWEHDLQMRQASSGDDGTFQKSQKVIRTALRTAMHYLERPEFQSKQIYWRCAEVYYSTFLLVL